MPLPLTVSCFSKIQIGFTFLVPAHPGSPGKRAVKRVCVCVCVTTVIIKFFYPHFTQKYQLKSLTTQRLVNSFIHLAPVTSITHSRNKSRRMTNAVSFKNKAHNRLHHISSTNNVLQAMSNKLLKNAKPVNTYNSWGVSTPSRWNLLLFHLSQLHLQQKKQWHISLL